MQRKAIATLGVSLAVLLAAARCYAATPPSITSLNTARLGESTVLTVTGSGFNTTSQVQVNGVNRPTIFVSPLQLKATLFASDVSSGLPFRVTVANAILISNVVPLAPLGPPPVLRTVSPGFVTQGAERVQLTLIGSNFRPGATVVISPPLPSLANSTGTSVATDISVLDVSFVSSNVLTAVISLGSTADFGLRAVDVNNADGTSTALAAIGQPSSKPLRVQSSNSLGAPLSVLTLAMSYPRDGMVVSQGEDLSAAAVIAGAGTGTVIGQWVWDGNVVEQFTENVIGGQSVAVQTRQPLPTSFLGIHTLELRIVQPNRVATRPVTVLINRGSWHLEELLEPASGAMFSSGQPPLLRWKPVPGAARYQVGFSAQPYFSSIEKWYDITDHRWQVPDHVWRALPEGELFWTVRTIDASGVARKPLPMRRILRVNGSALASQRVEPGRTPAGNILLEWTPLGFRTLYLTIITADHEGSQVVRRYLSSQPQLDLRALEDRFEPGKTYFWRTKAISAQGKVLMTGPTQSFVAGARRKAALHDRRGRVAELASLTPSSLHIVDGDLTPQIAKRAPAPDSTVNEAQPVISIEFQSKVETTSVSLQVDETDVTALTQLSETQINYTPAIALSNGNHTISVAVAKDTAKWQFTVNGVPSSSAEQSVAAATDAEVPPTPAAENAAPAAPDTTNQQTTTAQTPPPPQLVEDGQLGSTTQWGSGGSPSPSNALSMAQHLAYQNGPWKADVNGTGAVTSVLTPERLRTARNHVNNYVSQLDYQGHNWDTSLHFGILASTLYSGAQFVTPATARQAVELDLNSKAGSFGYFINTNDLAHGGGSGISFHQRIMGASWLAPLPKKWVEFRFMWLNAEDLGTPTTVSFDGLGHPIVIPNTLAPKAKGNLFGALLLVHLTPLWTWTSEYAWGNNNPNITDPASTSLFGQAWRTGVAGQAGKTMISVAYRDVGARFGDPANPSLTLVSKPGLRGMDSTVTQTTNAGTFAAGYSLMVNNLKSESTPELLLHSMSQSWSKLFGVKTNVTISASESLTQTGDVPAPLLLLPLEARGLQDLRNISGSASLSRQFGTVALSLNGSRSWSRNDLLPTADVITSGISLGANWTSKSIFQLNSSLSFNWVAADKFTLGESRNIALSLQPSIQWTKLSLQLAPIIAVTHGRTMLADGTLTNNTFTGQYGGRVAWTLPGMLKFNTISLQGNFGQNYNTVTALDQRNTQVLAVWSATWGQRKQAF